MKSARDTPPAEQMMILVEAILEFCEDAFRAIRQPEKADMNLLETKGRALQIRLQKYRERMGKRPRLV